MEKVTSWLDENDDQVHQFFRNSKMLGKLVNAPKNSSNTV
jgi:hypothetical protein